MTDQIITRFAPSPTGFLHIGGARTALFNWLFAKKHGGKMLLRIEDTDRERSTPEAVEAILDGLGWLGLEWDGDPISQFEGADRHRAVAHDLVKNGKAYHCFATPEELQQMREEAKAAGRSTNYDRRWRDRNPKEAPQGAPSVIRLKAPLDGATVIDDQVQGPVTFQNKDLDDFVILRSDGTPTYMLAVVVDDHDMGITHIIRGDDHLTNAGRQALIYDAMGWNLPVMAHIPLIHGADGAKLSKRHGALGAEAYRDMGYLPEAVRNYLVRLGWSHGDEEIISLENMIEWFDFDGLGKAPSRFDIAKLQNINAHYIREADDHRLLDLVEELSPVLDHGSAVKTPLSAPKSQMLLKAMPFLKERAKTVDDLIVGASFILEDDPITLDEKSLSVLADGGAEMLTRLSALLEPVAEWNRDSLETVLKSYIEEHELKFAKVGQPLRAALCGKMQAPGVFDVLDILGRDLSLQRINSHASTA